MQKRKANRILQTYGFRSELVGHAGKADDGLLRIVTHLPEPFMIGPGRLLARQLVCPGEHVNVLIGQNDFAKLRSLGESCGNARIQWVFGVYALLHVGLHCFQGRRENVEETDPSFSIQS